MAGMQPFPHHYLAHARGAASGFVSVGAPDVEAIATHAPPEFGGPRGKWSPEALLVAAVADCYVLSFRAAARASKLAWLSLDAQAEGVLDRDEDGVTRFTQFLLAPTLVLPEGSSETLARAVLQEAKRLCLVTNSLRAQCELKARLEIAPTAQAQPAA